MEAVFCYPYRGRRLLVALSWKPCFGTPIVEGVFWYPYRGRRVLFPGYPSDYTGVYIVRTCLICRLYVALLVTIVLYDTYRQHFRQRVVGMGLVSVLMAWGVECSTVYQVHRTEHLTVACCDTTLRWVTLCGTTSRYIAPRSPLCCHIGHIYIYITLYHYFNPVTTACGNSLQQ